MLTNIAVNFMTTTDVMMLGWLSPKALAAGALGYNLYMPLFLFCIGVIGAVAPIAASLVGADPRRLGPAPRVPSGVPSAFVLAAPAWALLWNAKAILLAIGEPPDLAAQADSTCTACNGRSRPRCSISARVRHSRRLAAPRRP